MDQIADSVEPTVTQNTGPIDAVTGPDESGVRGTKIGCTTLHDMDDPRGASVDEAPGDHGILPDISADSSLKDLVVALLLVRSGGTGVLPSSRLRGSDVVAGAVARPRHRGTYDLRGSSRD